MLWFLGGHHRTLANSYFNFELSWYSWWYGRKFAQKEHCLYKRLRNIRDSAPGTTF